METEVEVYDALLRHSDSIAASIMEPEEEVIHKPGCLVGKRITWFGWRWPFVRTWISTAICFCEANALLGTPQVNRIDVAHLSPRKAAKLVREWKEYHERLWLRASQRLDRKLHSNIDDIVAILDGLND